MDIKDKIIKMKKQIKEEIFSKDYIGEYTDIHFSDLPKDIQENDIIEIQREEKYISENNSYDAFTRLIVIREREETDEEYKARLERLEARNEHTRKLRYESYLKLKAEFESE